VRWTIALCALAAACGDDGGAVPIDASPRPDGPVVDAAVGVEVCDQVCQIPSHFCCAEQIVPPQFSRFCVETAMEEICMGNRYFCDGPEDCADNEVCCTDSGSEVRCTDPATCAGQGYVVCHVNAHCPAPSACLDTPLGFIRACQ
jgi:hypothetical protein